MTVIDDVAAATAIQFSSISFHQQLPFGMESDRSIDGFCVPKEPGWVLSISASALGIPIDGLQLPFNGQAAPGGDQITWSMDQPLDANGGGAHVSHVRGSIVTAVSAVPGQPSMDCSGAPLVQRATLQSVPESSSLAVDTNFGQAAVSNISTTLSVSEPLGPLNFSVRIRGDRWSGNACGTYWLNVGDHVRFTASMINVSSPDPITETSCQWVLPGGVPGPADFYVDYDFPDPGRYAFTATISASTALEGPVPFSNTATFAVLSDDEARLRTLMCDLRRALGQQRQGTILVPGSGAGGQVGDIRFVDPLWDPTPDELRNAYSMLESPYSTSELTALRNTLQQASKLSMTAAGRVDALLKATEKFG